MSKTTLTIFIALFAIGTYLFGGTLFFTLFNLCKSKIPNQPESGKITIVNFPERKFIGKYYENVPKRNKMGKCASDLYQFFFTKLFNNYSFFKVCLNYPLTSRYYAINQMLETFTFSCGFLVPSNITTLIDKNTLQNELGIKIETVEGGEYATTRFIGPYSKLSEAWSTFENNLKDKFNKEMEDVSKGNVFEEYWTDPMTEKDENKYITDLSSKLNK
ncbi:hypothetical protein ABK040_008249 [Willaertia magna]